MKSASNYYDMAIELGISYGPNLALALITLLVGWWVIKGIEKIIQKTLNVREIDPSLHSFFTSLSGISLKVLLVISVASMIGVEMTSFIAILGAAGLAVGMALSGTLQNFAGGVMILIFRPFKVGDFIEAQGFVGSVKEIQVFNTILRTGDNKTIIIPNGSISGSSLINYSIEETRRVDFVFGIGYDDDIDQARSIIDDIASADPRVYQDPTPFIVVSELADSSVNLTVRLWVDSENYWGVYFDTLEGVKKAFDRNGISIPYPQQDVYMHQAVPADIKKAANE